MASVNDILRITQCGNLFSQRVCNVFYYIVALWTGNVALGDVASEFAGEVIVPVLGAQSDELNWTQITIENLTDPDEFEEFPVNYVGLSPDDPMPPFVTVAVVLNRTTKATRNGRKAFAGIVESAVTDGALNWDAAAKAPILSAYGGSVELDMGGGDAFDIRPVIVGRNPDGTLNLAVTNLVKSASIFKLGSQNSRKIGRGQ